MSTTKWRAVLEYVMSGKPGISARTIISAATGVPVEKTTFGHDIPYDPSDFGRCQDVFKTFPEWKEPFKKYMTDFYPYWKPFVDNWEKMEEMLVEDLKKTPDRAPNLYNFMKELVEESRKIREKKKGRRRRGNRSRN